MFTFDHVLNTIGTICTVSIWWMALQERRRNKGQAEVELKMPSKRWLFMAALSTLPLATLLIHNLVPAPLQEFDEPNQRIVSGWAHEGESCTMQVNQKYLEQFRADYKLAIACLIWDGRQDLIDDPYMNVGGLYDIDKNGAGKKLISPFTPSFTQLYVQTHSIGVYVALLLVPNGVETRQFGTLRQARALGVRIPYNALAGGKPI